MSHSGTVVQYSVNVTVVDSIPTRGNDYIIGFRSFQIWLGYENRTRTLALLENKINARAALNIGFYVSFHCEFDQLN